MKTLGQKSFWIIFGGFAGLLLTIEILTVGFFYSRGRATQYDFLEAIVETRGNLHDIPQRTGKAFDKIFLSYFDSRYFYVEADKVGKIFTINPMDFSKISQNDLNVLINKINRTRTQKGVVGNYRFYIDSSSRFSYYAIIDTTMMRGFQRNFIEMLLFIFTGFVILLFFVSLISTHKILRATDESFNMQRKFIADDSHEIRTPLSSILANVHCLGLELDDNKWLQNIRYEVERLVKLSDELFSLAQLEHGGLNNSAEDFNLSQDVSELALVFETRAIEARRNFVWRIEPNIFVRGYRDKLQKLVLILLDNALKYSDEHGKISVAIERKGNKVTVHVYNTGSGIMSSEQQNIFKRFYRGDKSHSGEIQGHGLGLSIAYEIAALHKTIIHVESEEGEWADFSFSLDLI